MAYAYSFSNQKRDLTDTLSIVIANEPRFISNFKTVANAKSTKHEWLEDQISGRSFKATAVSSGVLTVSTGDAGKVKEGTLFNVAGDAAVFRVVAVSGTSVTVALAAANGSQTTVVPKDTTLEIIATPTADGSNEGESTFHQSGTAFNYTQIFRKDIVLSGTALAINVHGIDNALNRQTAFAMQELTRDLNRVALRGVMRQSAAGVPGSAGGLYHFGTQAGGLSIALATAAKLDSKLINDAAQMILGEGGRPSQILCSPGQARVLSAELKSQVQILRADDRRGAYVAVVVNDINGRGMTIMADPDVPDTDAWVLDTDGFGLSYLNGRAITDEDATLATFDGVMRRAIGELTFEFKNAKQRICRISGLTASTTALN